MRKIRIPCSRCLLILCASLPSQCLEAMEYTAPGLSSIVSASTAAGLHDGTTVSAIALNDGKVLLVVRSSIRGVAEIQHESVLVYLDENVLGYSLGGGGNELPTEEITMLTNARISDSNDLPIEELTLFDFGNRHLHVIVSAADRAEAQAAILSGDAFLATVTLEDGTIEENPANLGLQYRITDVIELPDGRFLITVGLAVFNNLGKAVTEVAFRPVLIITRNVEFQEWRTYMEFPDLVGLAEPIEASEPLGLIVDASKVQDITNAILDGEALRTTAREMWIYSAPPKGIDSETFAAYLGTTDGSLKFSENTAFLQGLQPGDLVLVNPAVYAVPEFDNEGHRNEIIGYFPFHVTGLLEHEGIFYLNGQKRELLEVLQSATIIADSRDAYDYPVRDPYDPDLENTYLNEEMEKRELLAKLIEAEDPRDGRLAELRGMVSIPWRFNDTHLTESVVASGEILIRSLGLSFEFNIRDFELRRAVARLETGVEINMAARSRAETSLGDVVIVREIIDSEFLRNRIPPIPLNIGGIPVTLKPFMYFELGADADLPQDFVMPLRTAFTVGVDMGYDKDRANEPGNGFFYEFSREFVPLELSDPTIHEDLGGSLNLWAEFGLGLEATAASILSAAPSMAIRFENDFTVMPLGNPWWSIDAHGDLLGRFGIDFLGLTVFDTEGGIFPFDLYTIDAGGPLAGESAVLAKDSPSSDNLAPKGGESVRWARAFQPSPTSGEVRNAFVFRPEIGDEVIVAFNQSIRASAIKLDRQGNRIWDIGFGTASIHGAFQRADGDLTISGKLGPDHWIATYDRDANKKWQASWRPDLGFTLEGSCEGSDETAYWAGHVNHGVVTNSDPAIACFNASGDLVWSKYFASEGDDEVYGIIRTRDGNFVLCGTTEADVAAPPLGNPDTENIFKDATRNGLLMKVDADGNLLWAKAYPSRWAMYFKDVTEAPDGSLYVTGEILIPVNVDYPAVLVGAFTGEGELIHHILLGLDEEIYANDPPVGDDWPNLAAPFWDRGRSITWTGDGLLLAGSTGVGDNTSAWLASLTGELGVRFFSVFGGPLQDSFFDVVLDGNGILVAGESRSFIPWTTGGSHSLTVMRLPTEGIMQFEAASGIQSMYLPPRVFKSSGDRDFMMTSTVPTQPPVTYSNQIGDVTLEPRQLAWEQTSVTVSTGPNPEPLLLKGELLPREFNTLENWYAYHRIADTNDVVSDYDGDGIPLGLESAFGLDPYTADAFPPIKTSIRHQGGRPVVTFEFDRAAFSPEMVLEVVDASDYLLWQRGNGFTVETTPVDAKTEHVKVEQTDITYDRTTHLFRLQISLPE